MFIIESCQSRPLLNRFALRFIKFQIFSKGITVYLCSILMDSQKSFKNLIVQYHTHFFIFSAATLDTLQGLFWSHGTRTQSADVLYLLPDHQLKSFLICPFFQACGSKTVCFGGPLTFLNGLQGLLIHPIDPL